jgi:hypothetical protein
MEKSKYVSSNLMARSFGGNFRVDQSALSEKGRSPNNRTGVFFEGSFSGSRGVVDMLSCFNRLQLLERKDMPEEGPK